MRYRERTMGSLCGVWTWVLEVESHLSSQGGVSGSPLVLHSCKDKEKGHNFSL